ncbi:MAG: hypothetical protein EOP11_00490 [Proteobacteria bacterium]|nr:MAG: hypothetical protein EOP11_00490 [Pseudomonadota bacterium]
MPDKKTMQRVEKDKREGKSASTQAGEFVRETVDHIREGKHGAKNAKQAIAIGLAKARRAGIKLPANSKSGAAKPAAPAKKKKAVSAKRSKAATKALKKLPKNSASPAALSRQTKAAAKKRGPKARKASARKAASTRKKSAS